MTNILAYLKFTTVKSYMMLVPGLELLSRTWVRSVLHQDSRLHLGTIVLSRTLSNNILQPQYTFYSDCRECPLITRLAQCVHLSREY